MEVRGGGIAKSARAEMWKVRKAAFAFLLLGLAVLADAKPGVPARVAVLGVVWPLGRHASRGWFAMLITRLQAALMFGRVGSSTAFGHRLVSFGAGGPLSVRMGHPSAFLNSSP